MSLDLDVKKAILENISRGSIFGIDEFAWSSRKIIPPMHGAGIVAREDLNQACGEYVSAVAREDYEFCQKRKLDPEHSSRVECLAYGIAKKIFTEKQLLDLRFDHGQTAESFVKTYYRESLLAEMTDNLLNPKDPYEVLRNLSQGDWDPHPVCLDCH